VGEDRTDAELLAASGEDPGAFRLLYERWAEPLLAYCHRRVLDPEVALELVAETFAIAYAKRHRFQDRGRPVGAWLYGIARRELARYRRRRRVELRAIGRLGAQVPELDQRSIERIEELVDATRWRARLDTALARLSEGERAAVRLRVVEQLDYPTVAARLGCSEQAARTRVHRGLGRLATRLEGER
jgi:RNA polymerase sigma factor (sigma-70 family)